MTGVPAGKLRDVQLELDRLTATGDADADAGLGIERVPGISVGILEGDEVHVLVSGVANERSGETVRPETLFRIASITTVYTATLVMQLASQGLVDLDRPLVEQLPEFRLARETDTVGVTPRHLLTHTSGISGDLEFPPARGDDALPRDPVA